MPMRSKSCKSWAPEGFFVSRCFLCCLLGVRDGKASESRAGPGTVVSPSPNRKSRSGAAFLIRVTRLQELTTLFEDQRFVPLALVIGRRPRARTLSRRSAHRGQAGNL